MKILNRTAALFLIIAVIAGCVPMVSMAVITANEAYDGRLFTITTFEDSQKHFNIATPSSVATMTSVGGKSANIVINFTDETIYWDRQPANGEEPVYVSFNNGDTWSRMKFRIGSSASEPENFSRYLNRGSIILLTTELGDDRQPLKSSQPDTEDAIVYKFAKINARPKLDKFTIDYETYSVLGGDGQWTLKFTGTQSIDELMVAYSADRNKPVGGEYGIFPSGAGINVVASENRAGEKLTFLVRVAATNNSAASRVKKVNVSTLVKTPSIKVDYNKGLIRLRPNMIIGTVTSFVNGTQTGISSGTQTGIPAGTQTGIPADKQENVIGEVIYNLKLTTNKSDEVVKGISFTLGEEPVYYAVRTAATAKNPASEQRLIQISAMSPVNEQMAVFSVKRNRIKLPMGYEACLWADRNNPTARWRRSVSTDRTAIYAVRVKNTAKYNSKKNTTTGRTISGNLIMDVYALRDSRGRPTLVASYIEENAGVNTASNIDRAVYIRAKDLISTIRVIDNKIPEGRFYDAKIKGAVNYSTNGMGLIIKDSKDIVNYVLGGERFSFLQKDEEVLMDGEITVTFGIDNYDQTYYAPVITINVIGYKDG